MFSKILIANRGEIACRIIKTARRMGIATVAVYSDADARSPHVQMADEAVHIGPPPAAESYLAAEKIIAACKATGAEAVHPGYGFLSERASFVEALEAEGIVFIGPPAGAIAAMGDKIESKKIALEAGVNVVPGFVGEIEDAGDAVKIAGEITYPVMMKASAGGGGKGMRLAWSEQDVREGFEAVKREGLASFGDDRVFIEKFIENPRHIEIQILGDRHGTILHLNERECSIQRRHQKVVEEAPSPFVTPEMRGKMGAQAIALARAVGYYSAGTVELIVDGPDTSGESFYFLEMNTRLQVEHPVTEAITGIDLVEQMIRVAAGEKLPFAQEDVGIDGWAIETRIYAEDPCRGFLPSIGRLVRYLPPREVLRDAASSFDKLRTSATPQDERVEKVPLMLRRGPSEIEGPVSKHVRVDDGVAEGGEVSMFYDPMIAKLITWGNTRDEAADLQLDALDRFRIEGPRHNLHFLSALMQHPRFRAGKLTTGFIAEEYPEGFARAPADEARLRLLAALLAGAECTWRARAGRISGRIDGAPPPSSDWTVRMHGREFPVRLAEGGARVDGHWTGGTWDWEPGMWLSTVRGDDGPEIALQIARDGVHWRLTTQGAEHRALVLPARVAPLAGYMIEKAPPDHSRLVISPMPGLLVALHVGEGDEVQPEQPLATIEAMKMENVLRAQKAGTVKAISANEGASLVLDQVIMEIE